MQVGRPFCFADKIPQFRSCADAFQQLLIVEPPLSRQKCAQLLMYHEVHVPAHRAGGLDVSFQAQASVRSLDASDQAPLQRLSTLSHAGQSFRLMPYLCRRVLRRKRQGNPKLALARLRSELAFAVELLARHCPSTETQGVNGLTEGRPRASPEQLT